MRDNQVLLLPHKHSGRFVRRREAVGAGLRHAGAARGVEHEEQRSVALTRGGGTPAWRASSAPRRGSSLSARKS